MGGKHNSSGRDDRSDDYEDRRPPEDERDDAQETVQEAAERAAQAAGPAAGPNVTQETVEASLEADLSDTEELTVKGHTYPQLAEGQQDQMRQTLSERYGDDAVDRVYSQLTNWKGGSRPRKTTQAHELTAKEALGIDAPVRTNEDGEIAADDPPQEDVELYQELSAASKAFMREHYGDQFRVYRAIRGASVGTIAAQAIDKPDADEYYFSTSVLSNYSTSERVAEGFDQGIVAEWDASPDDVALAADHVQPHDSTIDEAEVHLQGGRHVVEDSGLRHTGWSTKEVRSISETVEMMKSPEDRTISEHQDIADLVGKMSDNDARVRSQEGADRISQWFEAFKNHSDSERRFVDSVEMDVEYVTTVDDRDWGE